jgi:hypothetical protein
LLNDAEIAPENRRLFSEFLEYEEYKLKRTNGNRSLDANSYKTLVAYTSRLRVVNRWFRNKPWRTLTKNDIQRVYDDLEDGKILTRLGKPLRDRQTFYNLILRSKPFELAGKKQLVDKVMQFHGGRARQEVRFIREDAFRQLVENAQTLEHRAFLWLCWDIGENARSILQLRKRDCVRQLNEHSRDPEYLVNLRREILKRSRRVRSELTNYRETVSFLDFHLKTLKDDDLLFPFGEAWALKLLSRLVKKTGVRCLPEGQPVTLKDLRSSMACDLLSKGWSRDEVNARLGHTPSSGEIDRYINYLAIDRSKPKRKLEQFEIAKVIDELDQLRNREKRIVTQLDRVKRSRDQHVHQLKKLVDIHATIAALGIEHNLGKLNDKEYADALAKNHRQLLHERDQMNAIGAEETF